MFFTVKWLTPKPIRAGLGADKHRIGICDALVFQLE